MNSFKKRITKVFKEYFKKKIKLFIKKILYNINKKDMELQLSKVKVFMKDTITKRSELKYLVEAEGKFNKTEDLFTWGLLMLEATIKTFVYKVETENEVITDLDKICEVFDDFNLMPNDDLDIASKELGNRMKAFEEKQSSLEKEMELKKKS